MTSRTTHKTDNVIRKICYWRYTHSVTFVVLSEWKWANFFMFFTHTHTLHTHSHSRIIFLLKNCMMYRMKLKSRLHRWHSTKHTAIHKQIHIRFVFEVFIWSKNRFIFERGKLKAPEHMVKLARIPFMQIGKPLDWFFWLHIIFIERIVETNSTEFLSWNFCYILLWN